MPVFASHRIKPRTEPADLTEESADAPAGTTGRSVLMGNRGANPVATALLRVAVSLTFSAALGFAVWTRRPRALSAPIDVIGWPTFYNFNYHPIFWAWRIVVWMVPLVAIATYAVLCRLGPLKREVRHRRVVSSAQSSAQQAAPEADPQDAPATWASWGAILTVPGVLVWYAVSLLPDVPGGGWTRQGFVAGCGYVLVVVLLASALRAVGRRRAAGSPRLPDLTTALAATSAVLGVLLGAGVLLSASLRTIVVNYDGSITHWPWLPWWCAVIGAVAGLAWVLGRLRGGASPTEVERRVRTWFLGSVLVLAVTMYLAPALGYLEGFDDSQSVVGADLLTRGYFPWRDFMFIHGVFEDSLRSWVGYALFEHSIWGGEDSYSMVFAPLYWVFIFWLAVYAAPRGSVLPVAAVVLAASFTMPVSTRWVLVALVFVLLAETLRRRSRIWTATLTAVLFVDAVLTPEASFQVLACFAVLVLSDLTNRTPGVAWWRDLRDLPLVRVFVVTGAALSLLLLAFLASMGALSDFVGYYLYFGPGHNESGTLPIGTVAPPYGWPSMIALAVCVIGTMIFIAWRWLHGHPVTAMQWTTLAAGLLAGTYGEKAWGRFDAGHVLQNLNVALPFYVLILAGASGAVDRAVRRRLARVRTGSRGRAVVLRSLAQPLACLVIVALVWQVNEGAAKLAPGRLHMLSAVPVTDPRVGYQYPDAVDTATLGDIDRVLDTYAGDDGKIFDFTNSPGYLYYLLGREPAIPFVHISMAAVERAQQEVIDQLAEARPRVVVFDNTRFGIPAWDGPRAEVRHFEVAQYLLDHWTPVLAADGVLFLVRNDLVADAPAPPELAAGAPDTTDLYSSMPTCDWGYSANYLESRPAGESVELPVRHVAGFSIVATGWAYDAAADQPVSEVLVAVGDQVVGRMEATASRPDVASVLGLPDAERSGFAGTTLIEPPDDPGPIQVFGLLVNGRAYPLTPPADYQAPKRLVEGDARIPVATDRNVGWLEAQDGGPRMLGLVDVPADVHLADYQLATFTADATIGDTAFDLVDRLGTVDAVGINRHIRVGVLARSGKDIAVRVGSCLQWHGFRGRQLVISQEGGAPIDRVVLSGVRD